MHKSNALTTWLARPPEVIPGSEVVPAAEWFVIITLVTLFFLLGCLAALMWGIWRRSVNPPPHVRLLMEMSEEEGAQEARAGAGTGEEKPAAPWERDADWWRGEGRSKDEGAVS